MPAAFVRTSSRTFPGGNKKTLTQEEMKRIEDYLKENLAPITIAGRLGRNQALVDRAIGEIYLKQLKEQR